jgi:hypothetical protein
VAHVGPPRRPTAASTPSDAALPPSAVARVGSRGCHRHPHRPRRRRRRRDVASARGVRRRVISERRRRRVACATWPAPACRRIVGFPAGGVRKLRASTRRPRSVRRHPAIAVPRQRAHRRAIDFTLNLLMIFVIADVSWQFS